jgi:hypothetical protein
MYILKIKILKKIFSSFHKEFTDSFYREIFERKYLYKKNFHAVFNLNFIKSI